MSHTILDLAHAGLEVVEREVAHFVLDAIEIHVGQRLTDDGRSCRSGGVVEGGQFAGLSLSPRAVGDWPWQVVPGLERPDPTFAAPPTGSL